MAKVVAQAPLQRAQAPRTTARRMLPRPQTVAVAIVVFAVSLVLPRAAAYPVVAEPVAVTGDTTVAATAGQLQRGVTLAVAAGPAIAATATPTSSGTPSTATFQQIRPFSIAALPTDPSGTQYAVLKVSSPNLPTGQYTAAVITTDGATW
ncbi:MAG: hypothetical protein ACRDIY_00485 [Chloroflexota bacterium]